MLALFRSDVPTYQPEHPAGLAEETGDPQVSLENLRKLGLIVKAGDLQIPTENLRKFRLALRDIWVRKKLSRVLFQFCTGELYLAFGLRDPELLAQLATDAYLGDHNDLLDACRSLQDEDEAFSLLGHIECEKETMPPVTDAERENFRRFQAGT